MKCTNKKSSTKQKELRIKKIRKTVFLVLFFLIALLVGILALLLFSRMGKLRESMAYNRSQRMLGTSAKEGVLLEEGIAKNLCVGESNTPMDGIESREGEAAGLFDLQDKEILFSQNLHEKVSPGNINQLMVALTAYEELNLEDSVTIESEDVVGRGQGTSSGLAAGNVVTVQQLINGVLVYSADDACYALARAAAGNKEAFVEHMNQKAQELGMTNTAFSNVSGAEDENQYTTVYDIYLLFHQLLEYPDLIHAMGLSSYTMNSTKSNGDLKQQVLDTDNPYLTGKLSVPKGVTMLGGKYMSTKDQYATALLVQNNYGDAFVLIVFRADSEEIMNSRIREMLKKVNS